jgi:phage terminase large subunit
MKIEASHLLNQLLQSAHKVKVLEGGSRSGKTYAILQWLIIYCQQHAGEGRRITISRKRLTWLKDTVLKDFKDLLMQYEMWRENHFKRTTLEYMLFGNEVSFIGLDEPQKLHGRKQDVFWINEAMEASPDDFDQLEMRTSGNVFLDYNPSYTDHWIYKRILQRPDALLIHSTMMGNPFLPEAIIDKIRSFEPTDENVIRGTADVTKWKVYGLGERAQPEGVVFDNINYVQDFPDCKKVWYGLDFGFTNHPTAIIKVGLHEGELYLHEVCYQTGLTNNHVHQILKNEGLTKADLIIADSADPKSIHELKLLGWNITAAAKGPDSIRIGIDILKRYKINITDTSINMQQEANNYSWQKDSFSGKWMNVPCDDFNHAWDAVRYVALAKLAGPNTTARPGAYGFKPPVKHINL